MFLQHAIAKDGKFTEPQPHGLHTDHSAEDPKAAGESTCIARIETLGTHYAAGDSKAYAPETQSMLQALRYWIAVPEGQPEDILDELLNRETHVKAHLPHAMGTFLTCSSMAFTTAALRGRWFFCSAQCLWNSVTVSRAVSRTSRLGSMILDAK